MLFFVHGEQNPGCKGYAELGHLAVTPCTGFHISARAAPRMSQSAVNACMLRCSSELHKFVMPIDNIVVPQE